MNVLCVGFGFVGKPYALFLRERGHNVYVLTDDDNTSWDADELGFERSENQSQYDAAVIAVPTPTIANKQDISILKNVLSRLKKSFNMRNIVIKSTVLPNNIKHLSRSYTNFNRFIVYPEFLEAKNPIGGVFNQDCTVFGKTKWSQADKKFIRDLFGFTNGVTFTNLETACALKYVHNLWLSCNLSFWNSMMRTAGHGIDFKAILAETHKSKYFGNHPWQIGTAYGGACLPKDTKAYISSVTDKKVFKRFISCIDEVNEVVAHE
jgi:UDPglucose 6-dehydrogenase